MSTSNVSYGSVEADENAAVDRSFDAANTYYLKDSGSTAPLTLKQRTRKLLTVGVPILIAVLVMGGFAWYLLRDFNNLYPGRGGGSPDASSSSSHDHIIPTGKYSVDDSSSSASSTSKSTKHSSGAFESSDPSCSAHSACSKLELIGNCCPTDKGTVLECC